MFHTSATNVTLTREAIKNKIAIKLDQADSIQTWGGMAKSAYSEHHFLFINGMAWHDVTVFDDVNSGVGTDGKFGPDIFKGKIVSIDYDKMEMVVAKNLPKKLKKYTKIPFSFSKGSIFFESRLKTGKRDFVDQFMFHSGYGRSILLDPKIAEKYGMNSLKTIQTSELHDSFNNIIKIETKLIPEVQIGNKKIKNVPLSIAAQSSQIPMRVFGRLSIQNATIPIPLVKGENEILIALANNFYAWGLVARLMDLEGLSF